MTERSHTHTHTQQKRLAIGMTKFFFRGEGRGLDASRKFAYHMSIWHESVNKGNTQGTDYPENVVGTRLICSNFYAFHKQRRQVNAAAVA